MIVSTYFYCNPILRIDSIFFFRNPAVDTSYSFNKASKRHPDAILHCCNYPPEAHYPDFPIERVIPFQIPRLSFPTLGCAISQTSIITLTKEHPTILWVRNKTPSTVFKRTHEPYLTICQTLFENEQFPLMSISLTATPSHKSGHFIYAYKKHVLQYRQQISFSQRFK